MQKTVESEKKRLESRKVFNNKHMKKYIEPSISLIKELLELKEGKINGITYAENAPVLVEKEDNSFDLEFNSVDYNSIDKAKYENLDNFQLICNGKTYIVPKNQSHIAKIKDHYDERGFGCTIRVSDIHTPSINQEEAYYFRYIIPVDKKVHFTDFRGWNFEIGNSYLGTGLMKIEFPQGEAHFYHANIKEQSFLIVESRFMCEFKEIDKIAYSVLLGFGFIIGKVYLNEAYAIVATTDDFLNPVGVYYKSLRKSIECQYTIFTTNVYSVLMPIAKRMACPDAEKRMMNLIEKRKWNFAIEEISEEIFSCLVLNFYKYDAIARSALLLLDSSTLTLELQPAAYCIAYETLCTELSKLCNLQSHTVIEKSTWEKGGVRKELLGVIEAKRKQNVLNDEQAEFLRKKVNNMNMPTNRDKLNMPFLHFGYTLSDLEISAIGDRNRFMHGNLNADKEEELADKLFTTSLIMHKLSCILILKFAGFEGYIINNLALYGKESKQWPFLRI